MSSDCLATPVLLRRNVRTRTGASRLDAALHTVASLRARRVLLFLAAVWLLNAFDLTMTICAQADGMLHEENPVARAVLRHGTPALTAFKFALVVCPTIVLFNYRRLLCAELASCLAAIVYAGVAFHWKFCYDMYEITCSVPVFPEVGRAAARLHQIPLL